MPQGKGTKRRWAPAAPVAATSDDTKHASSNEQSVATEEHKSSDEMESRAANDEDNGPPQALQLTAIDPPPISSTPNRWQQLQGDYYGGASNQDRAGIQALASILSGSSDEQVSKKTSRFVCLREKPLENVLEEAQEPPKEGDGSTDYSAMLASPLIQPQAESLLGDIGPKAKLRILTCVQNKKNWKLLRQRIADDNISHEYRSFLEARNMA
jgi:hypothetical protein